MLLYFAPTFLQKKKSVFFSSNIPFDSPSSLIGGIVAVIIRSASDAISAIELALDSVVKIFTVSCSPNYLLPWQNKSQRETMGSVLGLKRVHPNNPSMSVASVIRTALLLPGPPLGNHSFPQEAYFEITILYSRGHDYESVGKNREGEKIKLIQEGKSEALVHVTSSHKINNVEEVKLDGKKRESGIFSLGLTAGGSVPLRVPGSYPGSIGFNSDGSVFLDGEGVGVALSAFLKNATVYEVDYCAYLELKRPIFKEDQSFTAGEFEVLTPSGQTGIGYFLSSA